MMGAVSDSASDDGLLDEGAAASEVPLRPREVVAAVSGLLTALLLFVMVIVPPPYVVESPGPTVNVLGEFDDEPLIQVVGSPTYPTSGALSLTTISVLGGPSDPVSLMGVVRSWLSGRDAVVPIELLYPRDRSADEIADLLAAQMVSSQENATVAALSELGYDVPAELTVVSAVSDGAADGVLEAGDILVSAGEEPLSSYRALADVLRRTPPGTELGVTALRQGEQVKATIVTSDDGAGGSRLGVLLDPAFEFPVDVRIRLEDVGGPSAGLMFALGIVDVLTPGAMTGGESVAGTGTISADGQVGPISGIRKKLVAARRDGAEFFLAPAANCAEVEGFVPDGLRVVGVATLAESRAAVREIGEGRLADLPGCPG